MAYVRWAWSFWYIYWSAGSGDTRDTQRLAIWGAGQQHLPVLEYPEVKRMREHDDWSSVFGGPAAEIPDKEDLLEAVDEWLGEVEEQYPDEACIKT